MANCHIIWFRISYLFAICYYLNIKVKSMIKYQLIHCRDVDVVVTIWRSNQASEWERNGTFKKIHLKNKVLLIIIHSLVVPN